MDSLKKIKLKVLYFNIFIIAGCSGIASTSDMGNGKDIVSLNKQLNQQAEQISNIEQELISHQAIINNYSLMNDEINQLNNELISTLDMINSGSVEQNYLNILNKIQQRIQILEEKTFYTDSLYFEIVNDIVFMENKVSSLILSFKEINDLSVDHTTKNIQQITDEEYTAKYIESLSHYQNAQWSSSLDGFNYLIQVDSNHHLADNCQYWIGEIYYALNDYRRSIKEFEIVSSFPGTNKSEAAQFKMGLCYINIGQIDKAKQEFKNLIEFYPNSEYYERAQDYLR